jgi:flagellar basal body rod protein FlgF
MQKTIQIPAHLTADQFGITDVQYFVQNIRGKRLPVVNETKGFITVQDAEGDDWTVNKGDLQTKPTHA